MWTHTYISINVKHVTLKLYDSRLIHSPPHSSENSDFEKYARIFTKSIVYVRMVWADRYCIENCLENIIQLIYLFLPWLYSFGFARNRCSHFVLFEIVCSFEVKSQLYTGFCAFNFAKAIKTEKKNTLATSMCWAAVCTKMNFVHIWNFSWIFFPYLRVCFNFFLWFCTKVFSFALFVIDANMWHVLFTHTKH